jgi:FKBP-type peptidyl-prolyl cis-trans isomerase FkpA
MSKGDSATVFMPIDSNLRRSLAPALRTFKFIRYELVLLDIQPATEVNKALEKSMERQRMVAEKVDKIASEYRSGLLENILKKRPSGLKMLVESTGNGEPIQQGSEVRVHYYGCLADSKMFDNSYQRAEPIVFNAGLGQMIPGFDEGVLQLRHGGKATLFIPAALAYGDTGSGDRIPPNAELIFYIEIL